MYTSQPSDQAWPLQQGPTQGVLAHLSNATIADPARLALLTETNATADRVSLTLFNLRQYLDRTTALDGWRQPITLHVEPTRSEVPLRIFAFIEVPSLNGPLGEAALAVQKEFRQERKRWGFTPLFRVTPPDSTGQAAMDDLVLSAALGQPGAGLTLEALEDQLSARLGQAPGAPSAPGPSEAIPHFLGPLIARPPWFPPIPWHADEGGDA